MGLIMLGRLKYILQPRSFEVEITVEKLKRYKSPGIDQIPAKLIQARDNT
jgi:hypothetical protein